MYMLDYSAHAEGLTQCLPNDSTQIFLFGIISLCTPIKVP